MFISFEGIDGCGKTTQAGLFSEWLRNRYKRDVLQTREPGGWTGGAVLREMVIGGTLKHPWSEAYLFMLDRAEHLANVIQPALASGAYVVCERYHDSTLAYQVWGRGLPLGVFDELAQISSFPIPDVTVLFDLTVSKALSRVAKRGRPDTFESEGAVFMEKVRSGYLALAEREPQRFIIVDSGNGSPEDIFGKVIAALNGRGLFND